MFQDNSISVNGKGGGVTDVYSVQVSSDNLKVTISRKLEYVSPPPKKKKKKNASLQDMDVIFSEISL